MPELVEDIIALVFTPIAIVGMSAYVLRILFSQAINKDLEQFKAQLQSEREHSTAELQSELQSQFFEYQTRFSFYHNKTAEVTGTTYELLAVAVEVMKRAPGYQPGGSGARPLDKTVIQEAIDAYNELGSYYRKHRYILRKETCDKMDELLERMVEVLENLRYANYGHIDHLPPGNEKEKYWVEAWISVRKELLQLQGEIEEQFRRSFTIETRKGT